MTNRARHMSRMMCKTHFLLLLFATSAESIRFTPSVFTPWGYKADLVTLAQPTSSYMISLYSSTSFPTAEKRNNRETDLKRTRGDCF
jgi:hypothetical protein